MIDASVRATRILAQSTHWDDVLRELRKEGFSKVGAIRATSEVLHLPLSEAKSRVHQSQAWEDRREADEGFHEALLRAIEPGVDRAQSVDTIVWSRLWERVALELAGHTDRGNLSLLTEDSIRWATAVWLQRFGVAASQLHVEVPTAERGRIDLVVEPGIAAIEFKFPRSPRTGNAPLTQQAGALFADIVRIAAQERYAHRFAVAVLPPVLERHLGQRTDVRLPMSPGDATEIDTVKIARLPETARRQLPVNVDRLLPLQVRCAAAYRFQTFTLVAYDLSDQRDREAAQLAHT